MDAPLFYICKFLMKKIFSLIFETLLCVIFAFKHKNCFLSQLIELNYERIWWNWEFAWNSEKSFDNYIKKETLIFSSFWNNYMNIWKIYILIKIFGKIYKFLRKLKLGNIFDKINFTKKCISKYILATFSDNSFFLITIFVVWYTSSNISFDFDF